MKGLCYLFFLSILAFSYSIDTCSDYVQIMDIISENIGIHGKYFEIEIAAYINYPSEEIYNSEIDASSNFIFNPNSRLLRVISNQCDESIPVSLYLSGNKRYLKYSIIKGHHTHKKLFVIWNIQSNIACTAASEENPQIPHKRFTARLKYFHCRSSLEAFVQYLLSLGTDESRLEILARKANDEPLYYFYDNLIDPQTKYFINADLGFSGYDYSKICSTGGSSEPEPIPAENCALLTSLFGSCSVPATYEFFIALTWTGSREMDIWFIDDATNQLLVKWNIPHCCEPQAPYTYNISNVDGNALPEILYVKPGTNKRFRLEVNNFSGSNTVDSKIQIFQGATITHTYTPSTLTGNDWKVLYIDTRVSPTEFTEINTVS